MQGSKHPLRGLRLLNLGIEGNGGFPFTRGRNVVDLYLFVCFIRLGSVHPRKTSDDHLIGRC
jgi:hypothetical protein